MKKVLMMAAAALAMTFASCGNKTNTNVDGADSVQNAVEAASAQATSAVEEITKSLGEKIAAGDATAFQAALAVATDKVAELAKVDPAVAKEYLAQVQAFLKEKSDDIKKLAGGNAAVSALVDNFAAIPAEKVDELKAASDAAGEAVEAAKEKAGEAVEAVKDAAQEKAAEAVNNAKEKASEAVNNAADKAKDKAADAVNNALKKLP